MADTANRKFEQARTSERERLEMAYIAVHVLDPKTGNLRLLRPDGSPLLAFPLHAPYEMPHGVSSLDRLFSRMGIIRAQYLPDFTPVTALNPDVADREQTGLFVVSRCRQYVSPDEVGPNEASGYQSRRLTLYADFYRYVVADTMDLEPSILEVSATIDEQGAVVGYDECRIEVETINGERRRVRHALLTKQEREHYCLPGTGAYGFSKAGHFAHTWASGAGIDVDPLANFD